MSTLQSLHQSLIDALGRDGHVGELLIQQAGGGPLFVSGAVSVLEVNDLPPTPSFLVLISLGTVGPPPEIDWLLELGAWADSGAWDDTATWNDGV